MSFIAVCIIAMFLQCYAIAVLCIIKSFIPPMHPQLLSLDNLVSTVSNGGHNHCVGFPSGQRWSVWPGRRLAIACFCPELATKPRRGEARLPKQKLQDDGNFRWLQKSGCGRRRKAGWEWLTLAAEDPGTAKKVLKKGWPELVGWPAPSVGFQVYSSASR